MQNESSPLRGVSSASPALVYIDPPADAFASGVKRVWADDGTKLGALRVAAACLSKATGWDEEASVHHILTDGLMSAPVTAHVSYGLAGTRVLESSPEARCSRSFCRYGESSRQHLSRDQAIDCWTILSRLQASAPFGTAAESPVSGA